MTASLGGIHIDVEINVSDIGPQLRQALRRPAQQAAAEAERELGEGGRRAGARFGDEAEKSLRSRVSLFARIGQSISSALLGGIGSVARGGAIFAALTTAVAALGPVLAGVGAAANAAVAGLAILPGAGIAAAASIATLKVAFEGVGDALKSGLAGDTEKYAAALEKLSPNARAAVGAFVGLRDQLGEIRASVQDNFFAGLEEPIRRLSTTLLPELQSGLSGLAGALGGQLRSALESIQTPENLGALREIFANTTAAAQAFQPALGNLVSVFVQFGSVATSFLPQLGAGLSEATGALARFVQQGVETGRFQQFFQAAIDKARELFAVFQAIFPGIAGLLRGIGAGGASLITPLTEAFRTLAPALTQIGTLFGQVLTAIGPLLPSIAELASVIINGLVSALTPLIPVFQQMVATLLPPLAQAFKALAPALTQIGELFAQIITAIAPLLPTIAELAAVILDALVAAITPLIEPLSELIAAILPPLVEFFSALTPVITDLATIFAELIVAITPLLPPLIELATNLLPILTVALQVLTPVIQALSPVIQAVADVLNFLVTVVTTVVNGVISGFQSMAEGISTIFTGIKNTISNIWNGIKDFFSGIWNAISTVFSDAWNGLTNIVSNAASSIGNAVSDLVGNIVSFFGELPGKLVQLGKDAIQGLINGLKAAANRVIEFFTNLIRDAISAVTDSLGISSPSKVMKWVGEQAGAGLVIGLQNMVPHVKSAAASLAKAIPTTPIPAFQPSIMGPGWTVRPAPSGIDPVSGLPYGNGGVVRVVTVNQNIAMPSADPTVFAAMAATRMQVAASRLR